MDNLIVKIIVALMILVAGIGIYGIIDNNQRTEDCNKANGTMINTPKGNLCVLNLEKLTTKPTQPN